MNRGRCGRFELESHPAGPWLLRTAAGSFAVPAELGRALARLDGRTPDRDTLRRLLSRTSGGGACPEDPARADALFALLSGERRRTGLLRLRRAALWLRLTVLPARAAWRLAARLAPLAGRRTLAAQALLGVLLYAAAEIFGATPAETAAGVAAGAGPGDVALGVGLLFLTSLWHELGHAAALAREGYRTGGVGAGILVAVPVFWCDVSAVAALPRRGRLRVDAAGICWQIAAGGILSAVAAAGGGAPAPRLAATGALLAVGWSLMPLMRTDGAWLAADLLSGPNPPGRLASVAVRCCQAAAPLAVAGLLCRRLWAWGAGLDGGGPAWIVPAAAVLAVAVSASAVARASRLLRGATPGEGKGAGR